MQEVEISSDVAITVVYKSDGGSVRGTGGELRLGRGVVGSQRPVPAAAGILAVGAVRFQRSLRSSRGAPRRLLCAGLRRERSRAGVGRGPPQRRASKSRYGRAKRRRPTYGRLPGRCTDSGWAPAKSPHGLGRGVTLKPCKVSGNRIRLQASGHVRAVAGQKGRRWKSQDEIWERSRWHPCRWPGRSARR